ncbi:Protein CBG29120 [Caenorhabditis briggsae]|uniref:Protein CBG29120 n=1 Tax=Caenorhabditis briggsae TaxID=6238 RepID=H8WGX4_CAEBR|nr:Protein CBG29120 [Caenorhabditis briggsae]CCG58638.1 Protein CBG29120 [Caenorhabditis briggsae]
MVVVFVHGVDENNQKFRRQEVVVCNGRAPPTMQPPVSVITQGPGTPVTQGSPQTTPTGGPTPTTATPLTSLQFDIVFMIDGSQAAQSYFDSFTKFIQTLLHKQLNGISVFSLNKDFNCFNEFMNLLPSRQTQITIFCTDLATIAHQNTKTVSKRQLKRSYMIKSAAFLMHFLATFSTDCD